MNLLLVEDNPGDVLLTQEALRRIATDTELDVVIDGATALAYLRGQGEFADRVTPDLVLLDLNLPDMRGHEVLAEMKTDPVLRAIPVLILTSSSLPADVQEAYCGYANTYITKPDGIGRYDTILRTIEGYWQDVAELPVPVSP